MFRMLVACVADPLLSKKNFFKFNYSHSVSLSICGLLLLYSSMSSIVHCGLLPRQWRSGGPFSISVGGLCSLPETCETLVKSCGPELVDQSK